MNRSLIAAIIATVVVVVAIFHTGRLYERRANAAVQAKQLINDATEVSKIEDKSDADEEHTQVVVKTVIEKLPEWSLRKLPDDVLRSLHDAGL